MHSLTPMLQTVGVTLRIQTSYRNEKKTFEYIFRHGNSAIKRH